MKQKAREFIRKYSAAGAFALLAIFGGYALWLNDQSGTNDLYITQLESCERSNVLRKETNDRIPAHTVERDILIKFLNAAEKARIEAGTPTDIATAKEYSQLQDNLRARVTFDPVAIINCKQVIRKP